MAVTINGTTGIVAPDIGIDGTTLSVDTANDRIGIGITNPDYALDVTGDIGFTSQMRGASGSASAPAYSFDGDSDSGMWRGGVNILSFATAGTEKFRITSGGTIGINNESPDTAYKLDVFGAGVFTTESNIGANDFNVGQLTVKNNHAGAGAIIDFRADSNNGTQGVIAKIGGFNTFNGSGYDGALTFSTRNHSASAMGERLRITAAGKVGIGTVDPTGQLQIDTNSGGRALTLNAPTLGTYITFETGNTAFADIGSEAGLVGSGSNTDMLTLNARGSRSLSFRTNSIERLRITSAGLIGVGTDNPGNYDTEANDFVVRSANHTGITIASSGSNQRCNLYFSDGTSSSEKYRGAFTYDHSDDSMMMRTAGGERLRITSAGLLNVTGGIQITENVTPTSGNGVEIFQASANTGQIQSYNRDSSAFNQLTLKGNPIEFCIGASNRLAHRLNSNGSTSLFVNSPSHQTHLFTTGGANAGKISIYDASGNLDVNLATDSLSYFKGGFLSIGTDSPPSSSELTVRGSNPELSLQADANYSSYLMMGDTNDYDNGYIEYDNYANSKGFKFIVGTTKRLDMSVGKVVLSQGMGVEIDGGTGNQSSDATVVITKTNNNDWALKVVCSDSSSTDYGAYVRAHSNSAYALGVTDTSSWKFRVDGVGTIYATNTTVASISDVRLKENIVDANSQWDDIKALKFRNFTWKEDSGNNDGKTYLGLIAQEVETISPGLVEINAQTKEDIENEVPDPEHKNVKYSIVWMKAMKALQEAMERIETLEERISSLEGS